MIGSIQNFCQSKIKCNKCPFKLYRSCLFSHKPSSWDLNKINDIILPYQRKISEAAVIPKPIDNTGSTKFVELAERYTIEFGMSSDQRNQVLHFSKWLNEIHAPRRNTSA